MITHWLCDICEARGTIRHRRDAGIQEVYDKLNAAHYVKAGDGCPFDQWGVRVSKKPMRVRRRVYRDEATGVSVRHNPAQTITNWHP